jgi:hypothetical protein
MPVSSDFVALAISEMYSLINIVVVLGSEKSKVKSCRCRVVD